MQEKKFDPEKAEKLLAEERIDVVKPENILDQLDILPGDDVADLGSGNGLFTLSIAKRTAGAVYAVDLEPKMLAMLKERAEQEKFRLHYVESDLEQVEMKDDSVDKVLAAFVIHEVESVSGTLNEIKRLLKPGGQLMIVEWEAVETESGPPLSHRLPSDHLLQIIRDNGFEAECSAWNDEHYVIKAVPTG
ncbi:class I SAM-dependent methyltransferase [Salibacterium halotolerans]|uniref:Methyltransferase domain-containing protein n=1 Tax=Salibacterium halotolerans TaxID=1884432 RepID=A0A1I5U7D2_9BACI|nr:class I SAM-dependent methyltransferase [Salibacterium halotolerans]SFP91165.1 Methyltransferase domain-containing protein [Salibacterium halotolerans]